MALAKGYEGKRPHTRCRLTEAGRVGFADYLAALHEVLRKASGAGAKGTMRSLDAKPA